MDARIAEKVRKLLALAQHPGTPEHEATSALARAQALMTEHGIREEMLHEGESARETAALDPEPLADAAASRDTWLGMLAVVLAGANGCAVYRERRPDRVQGLRIVGRPSDAASVRYLLGYCARAVDALAQRHRKGRTWRNQYRLGCVDAIAAAIRREVASTRASVRQEATSAGALVRVDSALARLDARLDDAKQAMQTAMGGGKTVTRAVRCQEDADARLAGRRDGAGIYPGGAGNGARLGAGALRIGDGR